MINVDNHNIELGTLWNFMFDHELNMFKSDRCSRKRGSIENLFWEAVFKVKNRIWLGVLFMGFLLNVSEQRAPAHRM